MLYATILLWFVVGSMILYGIALWRRGDSSVGAFAIALGALVLIAAYAV